MEVRNGLIEIIVALIVAIVALYYSSSFEMFEEFGYVGVFFVSLISSATIFIPVPGWGFVIAMGSVLEPVLVGIAAGLGAALGEFTGYFFGNGCAKTFDKRLPFYNAQKKFIKRFELIALFILAFIPNPIFDAAAITAGALKIPPTHFFIVLLFARTLRYILFAYFGFYILS